VVCLGGAAIPTGKDEWFRMKGYSSLSRVIDREEAAQAKKKAGRLLKNRLRETKKAKKRFIEELKKQVKA